MNTKQYKGFYYDRLKDCNSDKYLTLVIPAAIRNTLENNCIYSCVGYLSRRVLDSGNIQINFSLIRVLSTVIVPNDEDELKALDVRIKKSLKQYKSFQYKIESCLFKRYKPNLALIIGNNAVIKDDIINALGGEADNFIIEEFRINLSSREDVINRIDCLDKTNEYDAIIIARGGGSDLGLFNSPEIVEFLSNIDTILVTAIGHAADYTFLQNIADFNFDTPTALGSYLKSTSEKILSLYNNVYKDVGALNNQIKAELENKEKLLNEIKQYNSELQYARIESAGRLQKIRSLKASVFIIAAAAVIIIALVLYFNR